MDGSQTTPEYFRSLLLTVAGQAYSAAGAQMYQAQQAEGAAAGDPGFTGGATAGAGFAVALFIRSGALAFGWSLPSYKARPGRDPKDIL